MLFSIYIYCYVDKFASYDVNTDKNVRYNLYHRRFFMQKITFLKRKRTLVN